MQTVIGRLTADATIATTKDGRSVVNFTIAQNDRFKVKATGEVKQVTTYFQCAYWMGTGITAHLKKGTLVEAAGRIGVNAYQNMEGNIVANPTVHVQFIKLHGKAKGSAITESASVPATTEPADDLPF